MQIVIDIPEDIYERFGHEYREENLISKYINDVILEAFCKGTPLPNITDKQISDAFQIAIVNYWEEKSKYLTPPPIPSAPPFCCDCSSIKENKEYMDDVKKDKE